MQPHERSNAFLPILDIVKKKSPILDNSLNLRDKSCYEPDATGEPWCKETLCPPSLWQRNYTVDLKMKI